MHSATVPRMQLAVWRGRHSQAWTCELKQVILCLSCSQSGMLHGSTNRFGPCELGQNIPPECVCFMCVECECVYVCVITVLCVWSACVFACVWSVFTCASSLKPLYQRDACAETCVRECCVCACIALLPRRQDRRHVVTGGPRPLLLH